MRTHMLPKLRADAEHQARVASNSCLPRAWDHRPINLTGRRFRAAALWFTFATLAAAGCTSASGDSTPPGSARTPPIPYSCPSGAKCPPPPLPPTTVQLTLNRHRYVHGFGAPSGREPHLTVATGRPITITILIKAPDKVAVGGVWLTINGYPSGFGPSHPTGKFKLLTHQVGPLPAGQEITTSWTAATLFKTNALDLTIEFNLDDTRVGAPIAHLVVTP
jgi:hypothetical protein